MNEQTPFRPKARLPRGFRDRDEAELAAERRMLETIRRVYSSYGFQALETSSLEYADALGKFLPDSDRPNEGVFSFKDDDGQWLSLRYDLTAPLARYVAENFQNLPKPFRRYQVGTVWRNEKPGPGRFREFTQFDADTVGSASPAADAELLMMCADSLEALGLKRGEYVIKVNSRKLLDGVLESAKIDPSKRGMVLRAIDKIDRLGKHGVFALLGPGRTDDSGDFTKGADLTPEQIRQVLGFAAAVPELNDRLAALHVLQSAVAGSKIGEEGVSDLSQIVGILSQNGYDSGRVQIDSGVVRGLDYYTGAVYEAQLTFPVTNEHGEAVVFGSVGGGGRYDDLVARFTGQTVPASGISIGVSRLLSALRARAGAESFAVEPLIVVLVLDKSGIAESFKLARELRDAGLRAETYVGEAGMKAQLKYADRRNAAVAIIEGGDERARGEVTLKDLALGAELAKSTENRAAWVTDRPAQQSVKRDQLVPAIRAILAARGKG
ncbi:MAG TPA: histidine--tRNA ligase [Micropepsaceae bacterium]|jgi:histidyl-tRNA synthetase|nr:histidine--tRNA ligase [Micropepsaceae bacterium]